MKNSVSLLIGIVIGGAAVYVVSNNSSIGSADGFPVTEGPMRINAVEANDLYQKYHGSQKDKLKVTVADDNGNTSSKDIKTFIIQQDIIDYFDGLVRREISADSTMQPAGLALTLGRNEGNSSTLIITALVSKPDNNNRGERVVEHLLPRDDLDDSYIYDYIDLCPHNCPLNGFPLTEEEYDESGNNTIPYDSNYNYWIRQN